jgi:hypothetical protein
MVASYEPWRAADEISTLALEHQTFRNHRDCDRESLGPIRRKTQRDDLDVPLDMDDTIQGARPVGDGQKDVAIPQRRQNDRGEALARMRRGFREVNLDGLGLVVDIRRLLVDEPESGSLVGLKILPPRLPEPGLGSADRSPVRAFETKLNQPGGRDAELDLGDPIGSCVDGRREDDVVSPGRCRELPVRDAERRKLRSSRP